MKDRIRRIMESQHMTQQVFAQSIGLSPATLSSIYNGRTNPTLNIVEAIKKKIPDISTDWLMFGSGDMYLPDATPAGSAASQEVQESASHFQGSSPVSPMLDFDVAPGPAPQKAVQPSPQFNSVKSTRSEMSHTEVKLIDKVQRRITEIRVFYDDQTWETFVPQKKS